MTVYKAIKPEAEQAAELAVALAKGETAAARPTDKVDNGSKQVPSVLLQPVAVTKDNIKDTVVKDGFWTADARSAPASTQRPASRLASSRSRGDDAGGAMAPRQPHREERRRHDANGSAPVLAAQGRQQELRRRAGAQRRRLRGPRRRGRRAGRRQRRRQVDPRQDDRRASTRRRGRRSRSRARPCTSRARATRSRLGIATVYQDLALCDNLDVVENLFLGREELRAAAGRSASSTRSAMEKQTGELLENLAVTITERARRGRHAVRRPAPAVAIARSLLGEPKLVMLDEPTAALGVRQTAQVLELIKRLRERGLRRRRDQPQPRGRVRGRRPDLRAAAGTRGWRLQGRRGESGPGGRGDHRSGVRERREESHEHGRRARSTRTSRSAVLRLDVFCAGSSPAISPSCGSSSRSR